VSALPYEHVSASQLKTFAGYGGCEMAWYYQHVEKAPKKPFGTPLALGRAFDKAVQAGAEAKIKDRGLAHPDPDLLGEAYGDEWAALRSDPEYDLANAHTGMIEQGRRASMEYATAILPRVEPLETQRSFLIGFEEVEWKVKGYIDLIEVAQGTASLSDDPGVVIRDAKATSSSTTKFDNAAAANDLQLGLYDVAVTASGQRVAGRGFHAARVLKTQYELSESLVESSDSQRQTTLDLLGGIAGRMEDACRTGSFLPTAFLNGSWKCSSKYCDFYDSVCPYGARARVSIPMGSAA
jgi:hypothetical protein